MFATTSTGPFVANPPDATYKFVRVASGVSLPRLFLPPLIQTTTTIVAATVTVGDSFAPLETPGQKSALDTAMTTYIDFDTDTASVTYRNYRAARTGNGKRLIVVPVNDGAKVGNGVTSYTNFRLRRRKTQPQSGIHPEVGELRQRIEWYDGGR